MSVRNIAYPLLDPDDNRFRGKSMDIVEKELNDRDAHFMAMSGYDIEIPETSGPNYMDPCKPLYSLFPWEESVDTFDKKPQCTLKDWKYTCLKYEVIKSQCAVLTFSKGDKNNTFDPEMLDALQDAIMDLQKQKQVRVVILRSTGKLFSNGLDPKYLMSESQMTSKQIEKTHLQLAKIFYFWQRLPQFTLALVQGSAMGASIGLLCACDMIVAVKGAFFGMSEAKLGVVASTSIPYIMRRITYANNARQLILAATSLSAEMAKDYGVINEVVEDENGLNEQAKTMLQKLTLCGPGAVAATKEVVLNTAGQPPSSFLLNYVAKTMAKVRASPEAKSGIQAIQEKKKPLWAANPISIA